MSRSKIPNDIESRIWKEYSPAPKLITIHENDPDLQPIDIPLPSPPPLYRIDGYGLPAKDQKFKRYSIPAKLQEIQSHSANLNDYWKAIESKWWDLQNEIAWIRKMQYFRTHGYWFFNHGVPTNITGPHFNYLNFLKLNVGSPHYRYRSYLHFHILRWAHDYTFDFKDVQFDRHGDRMPNKYGDDLVDTLERKLYGVLEPKFRRCGFTSEDLAWILLRIQMFMYCYSGLQNFTGKKAKDLWDKFVFLWRKQPMFLMPIWTGDTNPASQIWFQKKGSMEMSDNFGIESHIDFATTANSAAYDGEELLDYMRDEGGKLIEDDLYQGWDVVKNTLAWGSGKILRGFALFPTTVGEFEKKGGENFYYMVRDSDLYQRTPNGNTKTGLVTTFLPADEGMPGFIDEWGNSMKKEAREHLLNERDHYLHVGTPEAIQKYNESCRLFPLYLAEAFITKNKVTGFNSVILNTRIKELRFSDEGVIGNLEWVDGIFGGKVYRNPCPEGRWIFYKDFPPERANPIYISDNGKFSKNPKEVMHNADPFNFDEVEGKRESNGGIVGIERRLDGSGNTRDIKKWETPCLLYYYCFRPKRVRDFAEDCLKSVMYYGGLMNNEVNNPGVRTWFAQWGCTGLLYFYWNADGTKRDTPGYSKVGATGNRILLSAANFVELHGHRIPCIKLLENCRDLRGVKDLTNKDDVAAFAGACDAVDNDYRSELPPPEDNELGIGDFFQIKTYGR